MKAEQFLLGQRRTGQHQDTRADHPEPQRESANPTITQLTVEHFGDPGVHVAESADVQAEPADQDIEHFGGVVHRDVFAGPTGVMSIQFAAAQIPPRVVGDQ